MLQLDSPKAHSIRSKSVQKSVSVASQLVAFAAHSLHLLLDVLHVLLVVVADAAEEIREDHEDALRLDDALDHDLLVNGVAERPV